MAATLVKPPNSTYTFASQPKAVQQLQGQRQKFRQAPIDSQYVSIDLFHWNSHKIYFRDESNIYGNIMYDRRVIRGNTYALHTLPAVSDFFLIIGEENSSLIYV